MGAAATGLDTPALRNTSSRVTLLQIFVGRPPRRTPTVKTAFHRNALQFAK
jgi:hypothetical protein